eukprot:8121536-Ditylum_brightwellii.AAC.1
MAEIKIKCADVIANVIEQMLFNQYPWPMEVVLDRGTKFMAEFTEMIQRDYRVTKHPITARNLQATGINERIHQTIGNMLCTFYVHSTRVDKEDPWSGILGAVMVATKATIHSTSRGTQAQLVFGHDAMLNVQHEADWAYIKE